MADRRRLQSDPDPRPRAGDRRRPVGRLDGDGIGSRPTFPTADPGVESSSAPRAVAGNDPDSLFLPNNMSEAMVELQDQFAAGQGIVTLHIEPGSIDVRDQRRRRHLRPSGCARGGAGANRRPDPRACARRSASSRSRYMDLVATRKGPRWYVQIDINRNRRTAALDLRRPARGQPADRRRRAADADRRVSA